MSYLYLNNTTMQYLNETSHSINELFENIFSFKAWSSEHEKEIKKAITTVMQEESSLLASAKKAYKNNYKNDYKFLMSKKIPLFPIIYNYNEFKKFYEIIKEYSVSLEHINPKDFYDYCVNTGPATYIIDLDDDEDHDLKHKISFIVVPEKGFFGKIFGRGDLLSGFNRKSWLDLERHMSIFHELIELDEFANKRFHLGKFFVKHNSNFYVHGYHNSIFVLAKEAIILNKFKNLEAVKVLRDYRKRAEWKIIKAKTGIDFGALKKLTPEIIKKLENTKPENFGDESGLFLSSQELKYHSTSKNENTKKEIFKKISKVVEII